MTGRHPLTPPSGSSRGESGRIGPGACRPGGWAHPYGDSKVRTLLATLPDDVEVRAVLASVYRRTGNLVESRTWGFLTTEVRPAELAAFAKGQS